MPTKRKLKQQYEAARDKVPHDTRQRYVNMFTEEFLKTSANVNDAFEKVSLFHLSPSQTNYSLDINFCPGYCW